MEIFIDQVCAKIDFEMPVFHEIQHVIMKEEHMLLVTYIMDTLCLVEHVNAYKVVRAAKRPNVFVIKELFYHKAFDIQMSYCSNDSSFFIVPYCFLC